MHLFARRWLKWFAPPILAIAATAVVAILAGARNDVPRTSGPLHHQVYVWQRSYSPAVTDAIRASARSFDAFVVLAAEMSWQKGEARTVQMDLDYDALKGTTKPIGLAIRVGQFSGSFAPDAPAAVSLCNAARSELKRAADAGCNVTELQIDFDCPESKLAGYQQWIETLRLICAAQHLRLTITALPSWLDRKSFVSLAFAVDGFVLQVHSFRPPDEDGRPGTLCDSGAAREAVERAARLARPFRVALPTYSYIACFDSRGKVIGISAEGPLPQWPAGSRLRLIRSDEAQIAELINAWTDARPWNLEGVIWYRLPVSTDTLNWKMQTLTAVIERGSPAPSVVVKTARGLDGAIELRVTNEGSADASLASTEVVLDPRGGTIVASDALGGFVRADEGATHLRLIAPDAFALQMLPPGESVVAGWVRMKDDTEVRAHVESISR